MPEPLQNPVLSSTARRLFAYLSSCEKAPRREEIRRDLRLTDIEIKMAVSELKGTLK